MWAKKIRDTNLAVTKVRELKVQLNKNNAGINKFLEMYHVCENVTM
jgi:hypothetical protein